MDDDGICEYNRRIILASRYAHAIDLVTYRVMYAPHRLPHISLPPRVTAMENTNTACKPSINSAVLQNKMSGWVSNRFMRSLFSLFSVSVLLLSGCNSGSSSSTTQIFQPQEVPLSELELKPACRQAGVG